MYSKAGTNPQPRITESEMFSTSIAAQTLMEKSNHNKIYIYTYNYFYDNHTFLFDEILFKLFALVYDTLLFEIRSHLLYCVVSHV